MKIVASLALLVLAYIPFLAQERPREADVKIQSVGLYSSYSSVVAKLGRPSSRNVERNPADDLCMPKAHTLVKLRYPGLDIELLGDWRGRELKVVEIEVTSPRWSASSIRVGAREAQVVRRFGKPDSRYRRDGKVIYYYVTPGNTGNVNFEFRNGRLATILVSETLC